MTTLESWADAYEFALARGKTSAEADHYASSLFPRSSLVGVPFPFPDAVVEELHAEREEDE